MKRSDLSALFLILCLAGGCLVQGCAVEVKPYDYTAYLDHMPRSILVLPPRNESTEVMASYMYLSTITRPLAERGYYVFPVAVIDAMMKENGLQTPEEMAQVSLDKIREVIDPDAVLYMTIEDWGVKYVVFDSVAVIKIKGQLVDTDTGETLWQGEKSVTQGSNSGNSNSLAEMLVGALISQIANDIVDPTQGVARQTNYLLFYDAKQGLLVGPRNSRYNEDQQNRRALLNQAASENEEHK